MLALAGWFYSFGLFTTLFFTASVCSKHDLHLSLENTEEYYFLIAFSVIKMKKLFYAFPTDTGSPSTVAAIERYFTVSN